MLTRIKKRWQEWQERRQADAVMAGYSYAAGRILYTAREKPGQTKAVIKDLENLVQGSIDFHRKNYFDEGVKKAVRDWVVITGGRDAPF